ncbi:hypothetical protein EI165_00190 [Pseudoalteromonas nigrifaciens]|uniref:hypothetical protein n=1 Tax=Pseudoalteromonas nigrifaciens TaxID=28109 RepID=UPI00178870FA|nr:hypothetical protein [Pseudoalteromonas nigrifaciens]MBE0418538.1 hypothetical protein [Pseudoalteromonas nigrifaciens]
MGSKPFEMGGKPFKLSLAGMQCQYRWMLKNGYIETFDLSWPCLTPVGKLPSGFEMSSHREVVKAFKSMGVR